jgi:phosphatidylserine/phosphatidylglycerophosphate/cardiolipin synthase-like enzyme
MERRIPKNSRCVHSDGLYNKISYNPTAIAMKKFRTLLLVVFALFTFSVAQAGPVESAFSPDGGAEALVLKTIGAARHNIRMAAFSFTSSKIVKSLVAAKRHGVDVQVIVDDSKGCSDNATRSAMNLLTNAGIPLRTVGTYKLHHDKYMIIDGKHVQTGSFNYTRAAAEGNSENVVVIWNDEANANRYLRHWQSRWNQGRTWYCPY